MAAAEHFQQAVLDVRSARGNEGERRLPDQPLGMLARQDPRASHCYDKCAGRAVGELRRGGAGRWQGHRVIEPSIKPVADLAQLRLE
jgi:hypothetical protein